ncbi:hypothetical protein M427DRAFT_59610 [Gonapodya prolifera JEL478]|uniref:Uncharacterized protein n=1 Tax=Gonapodya prolifera (strain JEL478) TaxID=1344416 RepID=A0A139A6L5_GONPJ|nr:hypothetical protein M427DRAFT_59610 [Gonapodya prolifera JEL478]|eukprot:KXS12470.1 hypothetical protein M427DRAFT_59610 [Gonapodya prolifera JEL478]
MTTQDHDLENLEPPLKKHRTTVTYSARQSPRQSISSQHGSDPQTSVSSRSNDRDLCGTFAEDRSNQTVELNGAPTTTMASMPAATHRVREIEGASGLELPRATLNAGSQAQRPLKQSRLTFGQSSVRKCSVCGMEFSRIHEEDSKIHKKYHASVTDGVEFQLSKNCRKITSFSDGHIVMVTSDSTVQERLKADEALRVANRELGSIDTGCLTPEQKVFLYVNNRNHIAGVVLAEALSKAYEVVPSSLVDDEASFSVVSVNGSERSDQLVCRKAPVDCNCGISRIWVHHKARRKGIAMKLLEAVCCHFAFGVVINSTRIAFSQPTTSGRQLAERFTGRRNFLVYLDI